MGEVSVNITASLWSGGLVLNNGAGCSKSGLRLSETVVCDRNGRYNWQS